MPDPWITLITQLLPGEPFRTLFLCLALISLIYKTNGLKEHIWIMLNFIFRSMHKLAYLTVNEFKNTTATIHKDAIIPIKKNTSKFIAWLSMGLFSLFTSYFLLLGFSTALLVILQGLEQSNSIAMILGLAFFLILMLLSYYFRGCAYIAAKESGINLTPWKQISN